MPQEGKVDLSDPYPALEPDRLEDVKEKLSAVRARDLPRQRKTGMDVPAETSLG
jgi:hypothetical protein